MKIRATQAIMECLLEQEVDTIFGYPGGTILNLYDELYRYQGKLRHILTAHEQGAAHAADGYARSTGKVGVCFATSGPGATNLTTGIATAHLDSSPVVFITCNVGENLLGRDAFQEVDITGIAMPITKATFLVRDAQQIPDVMRQAFAIAANGRPGPVLIDFLKNVTAADQMVDYEFIPWRENRRCAALRDLNSSHELKNPEPDRQDVDTLLDMIAQAEKPLLICGGGVVRGRADKEFRTFAERLDAPVSITVMGGGGFPGLHPLTAGMIGMHGSEASNVACDECDLLIAVGCRFSDRVALDPGTFARNAKIVQIDLDRAEIDKNVLTDHHIVGSAKRVLGMLNEKMPQYDHTAWKEHILPRRSPSVAPDSDHLTPQQVLEAIHQQAHGSIIATDVGQHQMWAAQHIARDIPRTFLSSGGLGTMGFGFPAAIGAKVACPEKEVVCIAGDGSYQMNIQEMTTASYYGINVKVLIMNNSVLGMVHQWQNLFYDERYSETILPDLPDFVKVAEAYNWQAERVEKPEDLEGALKRLIEADRPALLDMRIDSDENVFPMVPAGAPLTEMFGYIKVGPNGELIDERKEEK